MEVNIMQTRNYVVFIDSSADLSVAQQKTFGLHCVDLEFKFRDGTVFTGNYQLDAFYKKLSPNNIPALNKLNVDNFIFAFENILKMDKNVLYVCSSETMYANSLSARDCLKSVYPKREIVCHLVQSVSSEYGLIARFAGRCRQKGMSIEDTVKNVDSIKSCLTNWIALGNMDYLFANAKALSPESAKNSFPILKNEQGLFTTKGVSGSMEESIELLASKVTTGLNLPTIIISHANDPESAQKLHDLIKKRIPEVDIGINRIGPSLGVVTGPKVVALFFLK